MKIIIPLVLCVFLSGCSVTEPICHYESKTIVEIGGCNNVYCGVKYSDGTYGKEYVPVVGQQVDVQVCR